MSSINTTFCMSFRNDWIYACLSVIIIDFMHACLSIIIWFMHVFQYFLGVCMSINNYLVYAYFSIIDRSCMYFNNYWGYKYWVYACLSIILSFCMSFNNY